MPRHRLTAKQREDGPGNPPPLTIGGDGFIGLVWIAGAGLLAILALIAWWS